MSTQRNTKNISKSNYNNNIIENTPITSKTVLSKQNSLDKSYVRNIVPSLQNNILRENNDIFLENNSKSNRVTSKLSSKISSKIQSNRISKKPSQISSKTSKNNLSKITSKNRVNKAENISGLEIYKALLLHFKTSGIFLLKEQAINAFPNEIDTSSLKNIINVNKEIYDLINNRVIYENLLTIKASSRSKPEYIDTNLQWAQAIIELYDFASKFQQTFDNQKKYLEKKHYSKICDNQTIKKCKYPCTKLIEDGNSSATCTFK